MFDGIVGKLNFRYSFVLENLGIPVPNDGNTNIDIINKNSNLTARIDTAMSMIPYPMKATIAITAISV